MSEEASKAAKLRAEKAEEEVLELVAKARQLETELDLTSEKLALITLQLEEKEKSLMASEAEMNALNRRVQGLEEDLERNEEKLLVANQKLDKVRNNTATAIPFIYSFSWNAFLPQPQFPQSCVFERFIYSQDQSTYFLQQNRQTHRGNI